MNANDGFYIEKDRKERESDNGNTAINIYKEQAPIELIKWKDVGNF